MRPLVISVILYNFKCVTVIGYMCAARLKLQFQEMTIIKQIWGGEKSGMALLMWGRHWMYYHCEVLNDFLFNYNFAAQPECYEEQPVRAAVNTLQTSTQ